MNKTLLTKIVFVLALVILSQTNFAQTIIFQENFESGKPNSAWKTYYPNEDTLQAVLNSSIPTPLATGGNYVGYLQDKDGSYSGSAVAVAGTTDLKDYSIEADVYVYVNQSLSAYTGLVAYADSSKHDFYKLRADFDASNRVNFSGLKSDPNTYLPLFTYDYKGANNTGRFPTANGWHKLKIEVRSTDSSKNTIWSYLDDTLLNVSPITDTSSTRLTSGQFGLYSFQQDADGIAAYYDNIVVKTLAPLAVKDNTSRNVTDYTLEQNYPNPFNPSTKINYQIAASGYVSLKVYDQIGREVKTLVASEQSAGRHNIQWDGRDAAGKTVTSGIYFYTLKSGQVSLSKKMIFLK